ncbi:MAG TPA: TOBE domain-containing protein, partial [Burkholderiaceae bacterium]
AARVTLVETLGAHEVVWLDLQGQRLSALAPAAGTWAAGDRVSLRLDLDRASLFDAATQQRLELPAAAFYHRAL